MNPIAQRAISGRLSRCGRRIFDIGVEWMRVNSEATHVGAAGISGRGAIGSASVRSAENRERPHVE